LHACHMPPVVVAMVVETTVAVGVQVAAEMLAAGMEGVGTVVPVAAVAPVGAPCQGHSRWDRSSTQHQSAGSGT